MNEEVKQIALMGMETTSVAKMDAETLADRLGVRVSKMINRCDRRDENGEPTKDAIVAQKDFARYMDEQIAMFTARGMRKDMAYTHAMVPTGERFTNRFGKVIDKVMVVKRKQDIKPDIDNIDGKVYSVSGSHSYSEGIKMAKEMRRGKYNDAGLLIAQAAMSIDPSEVTPFSMACV